MTDASREAQWTAPPTALGLANPDGPIRYALVYRAGDRVGAVWMTEGKGDVPRAGLVIDSANVDGDFQDDLGPVTLTVRSDRELDAAEFIAHLSETRTGVGGTLAVGEVVEGESVAALRRLMRKAA